MNEAQKDGDGQDNNDQNTRDGKVGSVPGFTGKFGLFYLRKKPVAQYKSGKKNRNRFENRCEQRVAPLTG
jgi:hypothetical protein